MAMWLCGGYVAAKVSMLIERFGKTRSYLTEMPKSKDEKIMS